MATCEEIKTQILNYLLQDIEAHDAGRYEEIGRGERGFSLDECADEEVERLSLALILWDGWQDSRNHYWNYSPGVE